MFDRLFGADADEGGGRTPESEPEPPSTTHPEGEPAPGSTADTDHDLASIREAISGMESLSRERRRFLSGYAYILMRVARADGESNDAETLAMERAVSAAGELPEAQGALLVALAGRMNSLYGTTEDYAVTREFARTSSPQERQRLMRACIAVGAADGVIAGAEATELYEIGRELGFGIEELDEIRDQVETFRPETPAQPD